MRRVAAADGEDAARRRRAEGSARRRRSAGCNILVVAIGKSDKSAVRGV